LDQRIVAALVGACVGGLISLFTAKYMLKKNLRIQANDKFRSVFIDELYSLEKAREDSHKILNGAAFEKHERAKLEFEIFLHKKEAKGFIEAWSTYSKYVQWFWGQEIAPGSIEVREKECKKARQHIRSVLRYTTNA
jgi:hypothetical protein